MDNFVVIGNDELGQQVKIGNILTKEDMCGVLEGSDKIGFVTVEKHGKKVSYVASINGQLVFGWQNVSIM